MQKVSYTGNGETTEFYFNFPYYQNTDVVVLVNNATAPEYNIIGNSGGVDADIPYVGGCVVFNVAPGENDTITISRHLPLSRSVDYQPLAQIEPTTLNQDMNYLMEVIKDLNDELLDLRTQYDEIANKESAAILLARISAIHDEIVACRNQINELGDVSQIGDNIVAIDTRTTGLLDYVIESQMPTAENNYTWYRKYKSGWVEQGGETTNNANSVTLPIEMADTHYTVIRTQIGSSAQSYYPGWVAGFNEKTNAGFTFNTNTQNNEWYVCGMSAQ